MNAERPRRTGAELNVMLTKVRTRAKVTASRLRGDHHRAEDDAQLAMVRAWRNPPEDRGGGYNGWTDVVTRNIVIDDVRARGSRVGEVELSEEAATRAVTPSFEGSVVDAMAVQDAMSRLTDDHRAVLTEVYFNGRTLDETAGILGIPPGTARSRSHYALNRLRIALLASGFER